MTILRKKCPWCKYKDNKYEEGRLKGKCIMCDGKGYYELTVIDVRKDLGLDTKEIREKLQKRSN